MALRSRCSRPGFLKPPTSAVSLVPPISRRKTTNSGLFLPLNSVRMFGKYSTRSHID